MQILKNTQIDDEEFKHWKLWRVKELDIFLADLPGELHHDYNKKLVRYKGKWDNEKDKITGWMADFRQKFKSI
ncbi:MAG: hypothetical protein AB8B52_02080 [Winogradskyella sp.]|uniref:hypothetical protein n=1 Tax=Winogradskyella sp. TaxID=1883156 RepID=UPI003859FC49